MTRLNFVFIYILHCFHRIINYFTSKFLSFLLFACIDSAIVIVNKMPAVMTLLMDCVRDNNEIFAIVERVKHTKSGKGESHSAIHEDLLEK